jgi:hypothetical protein
VRLTTRRSSKKGADTNARWKCFLGFVPDEVVRHTLQATTQIVPSVEAETREVMRDHLQFWLP